MSKFEKINIGDKAELTHIVTQKDLDNFVTLTGDDNRLHTDSDYASKTTFKKPVVHGMLSASFISTIIGTKLPGDGALWFSQSLEFLLPVRINDEIKIKAEVTKKIEREQVIELQTDIYNQNNQKVTTGKAKVKIIEQEKVLEQEKVDLPLVALVIGASGGIGKETCLTLAKEGFDIVAHYFNNKDVIDELEKAITAMGKSIISIKADILDENQINEMFSQINRKFSTLTALVNCATVKIPNIKFQNLEWNMIQKHIDINIKANFNLTKQVLPLMEKQHYGKIVNITTQYIETCPSEQIHYITAKSALKGFSSALAIELAPKGIRVNMVSPGMTETDLIADVPEKIKLVTEAKTPLKKLATTKDIANVISFLVSNKSDHLTGETIRVNGGQVML